jgi:predicted permease
MHSVDHRSSSSLLHRTGRRIRRTWAAINDFMSMPLWATLASLIVACVHPVQNILDNHMEPVKGALASAGNCSIPLTLVVLGAYFYVPPKEASGGKGVRTVSASRSTESLADSFKDLVFFKRKKSRSPVSVSNEPVFPGETKTVVIAVLSRMLITPLLLMPLMAMATMYDWHKVLDE